MAELVGGALLSAVFQGLFERITSPDVLEFVRGKKFTDKSLQKLTTTLDALRAVLIDAEQKQIRNPAVKHWLDALKDAVYHADDLMDEISTRAATGKEVGNFFSRSLNLCDRKMGTKIEGIIDKLEFILRQKDILGLKEYNVRENWSWRPQSTSLFEESDVFGRDSDKEKLINLLVSDDRNDSKISVIPIVGMGGIGKTTLAQVAYNDDHVKRKFDLRAWVCVSEEFDIFRITQSMIEAVTSSVSNKKDLNSLQLELKELLIGKKFLIVLDDIWNENYDDWDILQRPFQSGIMGSKVVVTTRSEKVALIVRTIPTYQISHLSDEDCWLLLAKHAFLPKESVLNSNLEEVGRNIVKKCKGLPLVAKTLGGLLRLKHDIEYWNTILKSDIWDLPENESKIVPALRLSYHYLSPNLKQCFIYCSLFRKGYEFKKDELILLWMAEGLLQPTIGEKTLEEIGNEYFHDLVLRSFFQISKSKHGRFVIHDLIHDLAMFEAGKFYLRLGRRSRKGTTSMTRHINLCKTFLDLPNLEDLTKAKSLRTLLMKRCVIPHYCQLYKLKCLRVLSLKDDFISKVLPDSIHELIHLRYLDLTGSFIKRLPKTLCDLYNLQTLLLAKCRYLVMLPSDMHKLANLRHLDVEGTYLKEMPRGIGRLKNLQFLSDFVVGKDEGASIRELGGLENLSKSIRIRNLQCGSNGMQSLEGMVMDTKPIEYLQIQWSTKNNTPDDPQMLKDVLDKLQPHKDLKSLLMEGYRGTRISNWLGYPSYNKMSEVRLVRFKYCGLLPPLGQLPFLKRLSIEGFDGLEKIGAEFYTDDSSTSFVTLFPSLEFLKIGKMRAWQEWHSVQMDVFPKLLHLKLFNCPRLIGDLPKYLPSLETLEVYECPKLASIPLDYFPNLKELDISHCEKLKTVSVSEIIFLNLECVSIFNCPSLVCFAREGLHASNMTRLVLYSCCRLKSLPSHMNTLLPKLQQLEILGCPEVEVFPPEGGLPLNVRELCIDLCLFARCMEYDLPSLTYLKIKGYNESVQCFSEQCLQLPSLTKLLLYDNHSLETLHCKAFLHLTSLQTLEILNCPKLEKIMGESLPASLRELNINSCHMLKERYHMKHEEVWPKISHIPSISITDIESIIGTTL